MLTGRTAPNTQNEAVRTSIRYAFNDDLHVTLKMEGSRNEIRGSLSDPMQWTACPPPAPYTVSFVLACPQFLKYRNLPTGLDNSKNVGLAGMGGRLSSHETVLHTVYQTGGTRLHQFQRTTIIITSRT